ncbi:MAG TPA: hypothetical protein VJP79_08620 [Nitrososphaera sp.]|nr:hypothetical protein [Nitrososphaera sp.]
MDNSGQSIQFFCSKCNTVTRKRGGEEEEGEKTTTTSSSCMNGSSDIQSEGCPACGSGLFSETMQVSAKKPAAAMQDIRLQTAYEIKACVAFGMKNIDSFLSLRMGDRLCITGDNTGLFIARLCIRAMMSIRQGGIDAQSIIFIDAGNSSDIYQCVNFARQSGLEVHKVLRGIVVSRAFTIYQLAGVIMHELPQVIRRLNSKLVVISDLLKMFTEDPQIARGEAEYLINGIMASLNRISPNVLTVVSISDGSPCSSSSSSTNNNGSYYYCSTTTAAIPVVKSFGKRIEVARKGGHLCITLRDHNRLEQISVPEKELRLIPS